MAKVLWFSRHKMTTDQIDSLERVYGEVQVNQIDRTINSAYELKEEIVCSDCIAIVAPINLQKQFLDLAGEKPVIMAINDRKLIPSEDGTEQKVQFVFKEWQRLVKIEVITEHFA